MRHSLALMLALAGLVSAASKEAVVPMVAVLPLTSATLDKGALDGLSNSLGSELLQTGKFRVMERSQMDQILKEQGFQQSGVCDADQCALEMGKLLSVDQLVLGSVGKVGNTYTLNARLVKVGTGEVVRSASRNSNAAMDALLTVVVPEVAKDLAQVSKPSRWGWWVAGGALVAGSATAAVLLMNGSSSPAPAATVPVTPGTSTETKIQVTLP